MWHFILSNFEGIAIGIVICIAMIVGLMVDNRQDIHHQPNTWVCGLIAGIYFFMIFVILPIYIPKFDVVRTYPLIEMNGEVVYKGNVAYITKAGELKTLNINDGKYTVSNTGESKIIVTQKFNNDLTFPACISVDQMTSGDNATSYEIIIVNK